MKILSKKNSKKNKRKNEQKSMLIEILFFFFLGIAFGTFTGLTPGIHINLISTLLISLSATTYLNHIYSIVFISSMAITHTFVDFIPSVFLGCPDLDTELSVLPGHQFLKEGRGFEAIFLSNKGGLLALPLTLFTLIPSIFFLKNIYQKITTVIPFVLIILLISMLITEKNKKKSILIIILTGLLGLGITFLPMKQTLFPLLTGLFGIPNILISIRNKTKIPKQVLTKPKISLKKPLIGAAISAPICSFLPGMGAGQAAVLANTFIKNSRKGFLVLIGAINTLVMSFSFITLFFVGKTRTGAAIAIKNFSSILTKNEFILIILIVLFAGIIAYKITNKLAEKIATNIQKINYKNTSIIVLIVLLTIITIICGPKGILILFLSSLLGIYTIKLKVRRTNMMSALIIPTILWGLKIIK